MTNLFLLEMIASIREICCFCCSSKVSTVEPIYNFTKEELLLWRHSFDKMIGDERGFQLFLSFQKQELSEENALFWRESVQIQKLKNKKVIAQRCEELFENYIKIDQLNIQSATKQAIKSQEKCLTPKTFLVAQKEIYQLMKKDTYTRFKTSDFFKELCKSRGISELVSFACFNFL